MAGEGDNVKGSVEVGGMEIGKGYVVGDYWEEKREVK
jgi:hypothetical protein